MNHLSKKKVARIKKVLAGLGAIVLALSGIAKLIKDNLSEQHAEIVAANERYTSYLTQSNISLQMVLNQVQEVNNKIQKLNAIPAEKRDYSEIVAEYNSSSEQLRADLNRQFDEVSKLIDALPKEYTDLRKDRDDESPAVKTNLAEINKFFNGHDENPTDVKAAQVLEEHTLLLDVRAIGLGDRAMTAADETIERQNKRISLLKVAINVFVPLAAVLGLIAAFWGIKIEGSAE